MRKRYNTPHRSRVVKTRMTEEEYTEFAERLSAYHMSQAEFIRQAITGAAIRPIITVSPVNDKRRNAAKKKELEATEKRIAELSAIFKRLYEDSVTGRISDERFTELSADYEAEQRELKERAAAIQAELSKAQEATVNAEKFMNVVRRHTSFEELTPTLLREFVEKIVVHECSYDENKTRRQDIEIYYSFVGKVDLPE